MRSLNLIFYLTLGASFFVLAASLSIEYGFGIRSCTLCQWQRLPYFLAIIASASAFLSSKKYFFVYLIQFLFVFGLILSMYHAAIQFGLLPSPCHKKAGIQNIIHFQEMSSCSAITWDLWGIPLSIYNGIIYLALLLIIQVLKKNPIKHFIIEKRRQKTRLHIKKNKYYK